MCIMRTAYVRKSNNTCVQCRMGPLMGPPIGQLLNLSYIYFFQRFEILREVLASEIPRVGARFSHGTVHGFLMDRCPFI